ncbi:MAG: PD40 domain-containing protein [Gemmatimonadales bacterium]|nr:MAG: PD40 domain-containing protein [Gemmatimonadales bacterium]
MLRHTRVLLPSLALAALPAPVVGIQDTQEWDVSAPRGEARTVSFTTTEGTWMSVDLSPDGRTLVFDLLGDLYALPVEGGQATRITSGPAWDVQPRFSPDGRRIAFTSDRAGGDNLWVMNADGSDPTQVSKESFRLLNGPAWTPDGQYLLGRKHFTSTRSLGAGEVWMYHVGGGSGMRITERRNDQQDQGNEIAVSPDGRYLYFSEDATSGPTFQYNKDPNPGIYRIRRLDRETGDITTISGGPGGAARPVPSPDGEKLALVRRVRGESVLYVRDLATGAERPVWDGLDHDQQEAWAIFGVYPNFAWTPDSRDVILWAGGKLVRVNTETRGVAEVPFQAEVEQTVAEVVRFPAELHPERFEARMITGARTTPDGRTVVFHAVGQLWKKQLPDGTPQRLTSDEHFEYEPSLSPDGRTVVYTTWDDERLSEIRSVPLAGGRSTVLTRRPGYYSEPQFSPDGRHIVFRRGSGNALLGTLHSSDTGLWVMAADGGEPRRIRESGSNPFFGPAGARIYFSTGGGAEKQLRSVTLDNADERVHLTMNYPTDVALSPDGRWVAWNELFQVYVAPMPRTGGPLALSKDMTGVPVTRVSRDDGIALHWSDAGTLHWTYGPEYFTRTMANSFAFVDGAPEEIPSADTVGLLLGLEVNADAHDDVFALTGARVVTMVGDEVIEDGTVVVRGTRIAAVGPSDQVQIPSDATVVDARGRTVIPGIVDAHAHANHFFSGPTPEQNWTYYANLAFGVTTAHDPSANTAFVFRNRELQLAGRIVGPRILSTGTILYGAEGDFKAVVNSLDDARRHVRRMKQVGAVSVKSYNQPRREQRQQILQAARELGMMVVPEGGSTFFHNVTMVVDGHTSVEHNVPVAPLYRDVMELWRHSGTAYTPTLVVNYGGPSGERWWYETTRVWENEHLLRFFPRGNLDALSRRVVSTPEEEYHHIAVAEQAKKLVDQGNLVQIGAHGQLQGLAAHWEIWMLEQGGMTPHEALRSATLHGARFLGLDGDIGSIEAGKLADLVVIDGNPLVDLRTSEKVTHVMVGGRLFDTSTMNEIGGRERERRPFWWQRPEVDDSFIWR